MVWTVCPPTYHERMSLSFRTYVQKLWNMCPHGFNHMSLDFKSYVLKLLINKCPYTKKRMSFSSNRMSLRIFTCVLTFTDICPHGSNHMCLCFKPFVLTLMDLYPHGIQHIYIYRYVANNVYWSHCYFLLRFFFGVVLVCASSFFGPIIMGGVRVG